MNQDLEDQIKDIDKRVMHIEVFLGLMGLCVMITAVVATCHHP